MNPPFPFLSLSQEEKKRREKEKEDMFTLKKPNASAFNAPEQNAQKVPKNQKLPPKIRYA